MKTMFAVLLVVALTACGTQAHSESGHLTVPPVEGSVEGSVDPHDTTQACTDCHLGYDGTDSHPLIEGVVTCRSCHEGRAVVTLCTSCHTDK